MSHFYIVASNQFGLYMFSQGRWNQGTGDQRAGGGHMHPLHIMAVPKAKPSVPLPPKSSTGTVAKSELSEPGVQEVHPQILADLVK